MTVPAWPVQQRSFAHALLNPQVPAPDFLRVRDGACLADRFDVYRNNVNSSLIDALLAAFPVTARLVSETSLRVLAREFLREHLPDNAALHDFGAALPAFIRHYAPAAQLPWLADVAALEYAWWQSFGAADATALMVTEVAALPCEELPAWHARMHPALRLLYSPHPAYDIWATHHASGEPVAPPEWVAQCVLITRPQADVRVRRIASGEHAFLTALADGAVLEDAAGTALAIDHTFDFGNALRLAIEAGSIQELHP